MTKTTLYDGLPLIEQGCNRGNTDYEASAAMLGCSVDQLRRVISNLKGMYQREPNSTVTAVEYFDKLTAANLTPSDIGIGQGKFQASRKDHNAPYTVDNFEFELQTDNLIERSERYADADRYNSVRVHSPDGALYTSIKAAAEYENVTEKTIRSWCLSPEPQHREWVMEGCYAQKVMNRLRQDGTRFWASDNIAEYVDMDLLIEDLVPRFESVLDGLVIDRDSDPNSADTGRRLAKMYVGEIMSGRFLPAPAVTSFPNDDADTRYGGMIVVRAELTSLCSHHHQPVKAVCYIGLLPSVRVIGLSKYARLAQWCARRGQLQEELTMQIANQIAEATGTKDLAVYIQGTHGCMENRGVCAHSSLTQTTELRGQFFNPSVKDEFLNYIMMQQQFAGNRT